MNDTNYKAMSYGEVLIAHLIMLVPLLIMWVFGIFDLSVIVVLALILVALAFTQAERLQCVEKPVALAGGEPALTALDEVMRALNYSLVGQQSGFLKWTRKGLLEKRSVALRHQGGSALLLGPKQEIETVLQRAGHVIQSPLLSMNSWQTGTNPPAMPPTGSMQSVSAPQTPIVPPSHLNAQNVPRHFCPQCGGPLDGAERFCPHCGKPVAIH